MPDLLQAPAASHTGPDTCLSEILTSDLLHKILCSDSKLLSIKMAKCRSPVQPEKQNLTQNNLSRAHEGAIEVNIWTYELLDEQVMQKVLSNPTSVNNHLDTL